MNRFINYSKCVNTLMMDKKKNWVGKIYRSTCGGNVSVIGGVDVRGPTPLQP